MAGDKKHPTDLAFLYKRVLFWLQHFDLIPFYGTLLGIIREGNFINGDDDVDMLAPKEQRDAILRRIAQAPELEITNSSPDILQLDYNGVGPFDIYFYETRGSDILLKWDGNLLYSIADIFPLKPMEFHGYVISMPRNPTALLEQTYGTNWRIPQTKDEYSWWDIHSVRRLQG